MLNYEPVLWLAAIGGAVGLGAAATRALMGRHKVLGVVLIFLVVAAGMLVWFAAPPRYAPPLTDPVKSPAVQRQLATPDLTTEQKEAARIRTRSPWIDRVAQPGADLERREADADSQRSLK